MKSSLIYSLVPASMTQQHLEHIPIQTCINFHYSYQLHVHLYSWTVPSSMPNTLSVNTFCYVIIACCWLFVSPLTTLETPESKDHVSLVSAESLLHSEEWIINIC